MKKWLLALGLLFLVGCGKEFSPDIQDAEKKEDAIVVGVSQVGSESVWRTANSTSVQNALTDENGYFLIFENARQKQENQIKAIRSFISQQVDYIVFSPITEDGWDTVLTEAKEAGIPVILMDRQAKVSEELYAAWIGSNFEEEGEKAGRWLESHLEEQGIQDQDISIVVLQGTEGATSVIGRTEGFEKIAQEHANWHILEQVNGEYTTAKGKEVMGELLERYDTIDVVVSQNDDMTFGALEAIEKAGKTTGVNGDITVISFDAVKSALELVQQGTIDVDIECNPLQGEYIHEILQALGRGEEIEKKWYIEEQVFTKDNVGAFLEDRTY